MLLGGDMVTMRVALSSLATAAVILASLPIIATAQRLYDPEKRCVVPIDFYCDAKPCPTYESSVEETKIFGAKPGCTVASIGICGATRFTRSAHRYGSVTSYFNNEGKLIY